MDRERTDSKRSSAAAFGGAPPAKKASPMHPSTTSSLLSPSGSLVNRQLTTASSALFPTASATATSARPDLGLASTKRSELLDAARKDRLAALTSNAALSSSSATTSMGSLLTSRMPLTSLQTSSLLAPRTEKLSLSSAIDTGVKLNLKATTTTRLSSGGLLGSRIEKSGSMTATRPLSSTFARQPMAAAAGKEKITAMPSVESAATSSCAEPESPAVELPDYGHLFAKRRRVDDDEENKENEDEAKLKPVQETAADKAKSDLNLKKELLLRLTSVSLMGGADLEDPADPTRIGIVAAAKTVAEKDAEFVLKMALYCRQELNIRDAIHQNVPPPLFVNAK